MAWSAMTYRRLGIGVLCAACASAGHAESDGGDARARDDALFDLSLEDLIRIPVSTGVRFEGHTQMNSTVSIVGLSAEDVRTLHGGATDLNMVLRDLLPSFTYLTEPLNDASSHVRAFSLRGLPPDETLVLVNGKRMHRSALVQVGVGYPVGLGSQAPDLAQLPAFALKRVEVLRDGASAQYGSDAIAGVINLMLSERADGGEVEVQRGVTGAGDGAHTRVSMNAGTRLGARGFLNLTAEYVQRDGVSRGVQRPDAAYYASQGLAVADPAQVWGSPLLQSRRLVWNARLELPFGAQGYMFGNASDAHSDASFNYRALTRDFFNANLDPAAATLAACPAVAGDPYGYTAARNCLALAQAQPGLFNFQNWFPAGFTPRLSAANTDFSQVMGVSGELPQGLTYDVSVSYARNRLALRLHHSINPSLGPASPTEFALGAMSQTERNLNADFVWPVNADLSLAAGAEWRQEASESQAGEPASWQAGPYATLGIGANGMPGIDPQAAGRYTRHNVAAYADSEYRVNAALLASVAARAEDFSDFGHAYNGKLSLRYLVGEHLTLRGALGTGFRAPSPGQSHLTNIGHNAGGGGARIQVAGIIPPTSDIARFFGARPLEPEKSRNLSLGMAYQRKALTLTADAYRIRVRDRIELSNGLTLTDDIRARMRAAGIGNADEYDTIVVFNNAADSVSAGLDLSAAYEFAQGGGSTELKLNASYVHTAVEPNGQNFVLSPRNLYNLANQNPRTRAGLTLRHLDGAWRVAAGAVLYGPFSVHDGVAPVHYGAKAVVNTELGYGARNGKGWLLTAGIGDLFNTQAHRNASGGDIGAPFISESPYEYQGREFYASAKHTF